MRHRGGASRAGSRAEGRREGARGCLVEEQGLADDGVSLSWSARGRGRPPGRCAAGVVAHLADMVAAPAPVVSSSRCSWGFPS
ncbi:Hypothetical protein CAP_0981 [Chondromyces apiculatus DSM 436]|uniref:Uncharacterized protein n=1 Tax=Chondromyces apiculatus DSM 436 TaxID=1192034 RepID=A0A017SVF4_9BACT|nr:Hypothetical protein CAP_0981 [Chondromyces apiculatus DSM 436]